MGKVREKAIKRVARQLMKDHPGIWTASFEENKNLVARVVDVESKKYRNRIAGYITRLKLREGQGTLVL